MSNKSTNKSLISSFIGYLKKPDYFLAFEQASFFKKLSDIFKYWSLGLFVAVFTGIVSAIFLDNIGVDDTQNLLEEFFSNNTAWLIVFIVFLWGPFTEEMIFRLFLRYSPYRFGLFLSFLSIILLDSLMSLFPLLENLTTTMIVSLGIIWFLILILLLSIITGLLLGKIIELSKISSKLERIYQNYFPVIFYLSTIIFAFIHIFNYANFRGLFIALPLLVAPQFLLGLLLSYIRMRYGISWSIFYHILHNSLAALPIIFYTQISSEALQIIEATPTGETPLITASEKIYLFLGGLSAFLIFLIFLISFTKLIKDHLSYLKQKKQHDLPKKS
jgi:membrane protease YdiL (CAAX protease family)